MLVRRGRNLERSWLDGECFYLRLPEAACAWEHWKVHSSHLHLWKGLRTPGSSDPPCMCLKKKRLCQEVQSCGCASCRFFCGRADLFSMLIFYCAPAATLRAVASFPYIATKSRGVGESNTLYSLPAQI